ncbi:Ig-like domain-containing protein [Porphyromonas crevioricanis]|uniref:Bacterial Ig-like domain (Group 2) n=3 Tax=Porphyromonas crevioricanis TaxID=393921 RepID=A0A2X4SFC6_9PORP|nr:Ig-like domain-containing protein [Porphyromonas crevioricanis]GAD08579.1 hypothetical protein PORCAN_2227 [Porphyromonas crevioricanis JCM 13913]SJZ96030.1 Ig-like domain (group 2) [Porphyromonas crevioricanis]SQH72712.1 Bacterial Ig-like domain (group 2) [Porphyromonas crevioricanis]
MRKSFSIALMAIASVLLLSLFSCDKEKTEVKIKLDQKEVSVTKGRTKTVTVTTTPRTPVSWKSLDEKIAKVSDGKIEGVEIGETTIIISAKNAKDVQLKVIVKPQGTVNTELPLFNFSTNDQDPNIVEHEEGVGREHMSNVDIWGQKFPGYVNKDLTITAVVYGIRAAGRDLILCHTTETLASQAPKINEMMVEQNYPESSVSSDGSSLIWDNGGPVFAQLEKNEAPDYKGKSTLTIWRYSIHPVVKNAKDFPDLSYVKLSPSNEDKKKLQEHEKKLGLRKETPGGELDYTLEGEKFEQSNIRRVIYRQGNIAIVLNCIEDIHDVKKPDFIEWLKINGIEPQEWDYSEKHNAYGFKFGDKYFSILYMSDFRGITMLVNTTGN